MTQYTVSVSDKQQTALERIVGTRNATTVADIHTGTTMVTALTNEQFMQSTVDGVLNPVAEQMAADAITAQRTLGEVLIQLPAQDQQELVTALIAKARSHGIDTTAIEMESQTPS